MYISQSSSLLAMNLGINGTWAECSVIQLFLVSHMELRSLSAISLFSFDSFVLHHLVFCVIKKEPVAWYGASC